MATKRVDHQAVLKTTIFNKNNNKSKIKINDKSNMKCDSLATEVKDINGLYWLKTNYWCQMPSLC